MGMKSSHFRLGANSPYLNSATLGVISHGTSALSPNLIKEVELREHYAEERYEIEGFIRRCFATKHGARIRNFMPRLLGLRVKQGDLIAAVGLRGASNSSLFLESYLDQPIEAILKSRLGKAVRRDEIIEVGNLSSPYPGVVRWLIVKLTTMLHDEDYKWVAFTGTSALRNVFCRLGLSPVGLGVATPQYLSLSDRNNWGSYYDNAPMVMVGDISYGHRCLSKLRNLSRSLSAGINSIETA